MSDARYVATIVRLKDRSIAIRLGTSGVNMKDDEDVIQIIDTLHQKEEETPLELRGRAQKYIKDTGIV